MAPIATQNALMLKNVRAQITRRAVDSSMLNVTVSGSVVHITGVLRPLRGFNVDLRDEMNIISQILRQRSEIQEVVWDVTLRV
ncbi:MAG TPA: hypothetical protein VFB21_08310 [Chthonomonadaceae bacterium]|jgi:hypothetical protein|nr:hypothetical protein [Chthonomonadaceae bacterium]